MKDSASKGHRDEVKTKPSNCDLIGDRSDAFVACRIYLSTCFLFLQQFVHSMYGW